MDDPKPQKLDTPATFGRFLRAARKARALTLVDLREATALSTRFLSELERGKPGASLGRAMRALTTLGFDLWVVPRRRSAEIERMLREDTQP
jgi:transcriptional regulator with XRE-family HTH domain